MTKHILTIGSALKDITLITPEGTLLNNSKNLTAQKLLAFEFGAKINIHQAYFTFGGGAHNSAVAFAKLNQKVSILTSLSDDAMGQEIQLNLKKYNINQKLIQNSSLPSPLSCIINNQAKAGEHVIFIYRGANEDLKINLDKIFNRQNKKNNFDLIYLNSLVGKNAKNNLAEIFKTKISWPQIMLAWNPGSEQIKLGLSALKNYLQKTDVLLLNKDEAIELCLNYSQEQNLNNPRILLKILSNYTLGTIIITDGANGVYALEKNKIFYAPSQKIKAIDTTGVGDAFGSAFVWAYLLMKFDLEKSLRLGTKNSLSVIKKIGAQAGLLNTSTLLN